MIDELPITVIIPIKNESSIIRNCLTKLRNFNQVIVLDSEFDFVVKNIVEIEFNFEYNIFHWNGNYPKKRNWALDNLLINLFNTVLQSFIDLHPVI